MSPRGCGSCHRVSANAADSVGRPGTIWHAVALGERGRHRGYGEYRRVSLRSSVSRSRLSPLCCSLVPISSADPDSSFRLGCGTLQGVGRVADSGPEGRGRDVRVLNVGVGSVEAARASVLISRLTLSEAAFVIPVVIAARIWGRDGIPGNFT